MKKFLILLLLLFPLNVFAYSNKLIVNGDIVGIEVHANGVYVVDLYRKSNLKVGDIIQEVNNQKVSSIKDFNNIVKDSGTYILKILRNNKEINLDLNVTKEDNKIVTGLYLKDQINGIGTLSYVDPETHIFASLGHDILEGESNFLLKNGYLYDADINYVNKSSNGNIGEVHANINSQIKGLISKNEINGIYGKYVDLPDDTTLYEIADKVEIKRGDAFIKTNISGVEEDYKINIIGVNEADSVKNIFFEIIDKRLLEQIGGIVQGMSGSPIIQNNKIIGVVNYVVVDDAKKGYGIYIKTMLEEGDRLLLN